MRPTHPSHPPPGQSPGEWSYAPPPGSRLHRAVELVADVAALDDVTTFLAEFFTTAEVEGELQFAVELAVAEVVGNVICHAYPGGTGPFFLALAATDAGVEVELRDRGVEVPAAPADLPSWDAEGGRGMVIARTVMDEMESKRDANGVNILTLRRGWGA